MVKLGTGLLYDRWAFDLRLSHIGSERGSGDRASAKLKSYFAQAGYYGDRYYSEIDHFQWRGRDLSRLGWAFPGKLWIQTVTYNPNGKSENAEGEVMGFYQRSVGCISANSLSIAF